MMTNNVKMSLNSFNVASLMFEQCIFSRFSLSQNVNISKKFIDLCVKFDRNLSRVKISWCFKNDSHTLLQDLRLLWQQLQHIFFLMSQIFLNLITIILLQQRQQEQLSVIDALHEQIESNVVTLKTIWTDVRADESSLLLCLFNDDISSLICWHLLDVVKTNLTECFLLQKSSQAPSC